MNYLFTISFACLILIASACKKNAFTTDGSAQIDLSQDSIYFDTVFTSTGSVTQYFKIYNNNDRKLRISSISVASGSQSFFKINADGVPGPEITNLEIEANDSLYVFVTVLIDPTTPDIPFIVEDSININYNGNATRVKLSAWGQNAIFLNSVLVNADVVFTNQKPFVILGGMVVDENVTLFIEKGTRLYFHADAPLLVDGSIIARGEKDDSTKIIFRSDRLDKGYRDFPGSWPGIYFSEKSKDNSLEYVDIINAYQGIVTRGPSSTINPKLELRNCIISNCYDAGLTAVGSDVRAENCVITNCGKNIVLAKGGTYNFTHCTVASLSNNYVQHKDPVLTISDFIKEDDQVLTGATKADFTNCIFWGESGAVENEVRIFRESNEPFEVAFTNGLWKVTSEPAATTSAAMIANEDPLFMTANAIDNIYDFRLKQGSPAIGSGAPAGVATDIDGNPRDPAQPDIGAYESGF